MGSFCWLCTHIIYIFGRCQNDISKYNSDIHEVINTTKRKVNAYIITSSAMEQIEDVAEKFAIDKGFISNEFKDF